MHLYGNKEDNEMDAYKSLENLNEQKEMGRIDVNILNHATVKSKTSILTKKGSHKKPYFLFSSTQKKLKFFSDIVVTFCLYINCSNFYSSIDSCYSLSTFLGIDIDTYSAFSSNCGVETHFE